MIFCDYLVGKLGGDGSSVTVLCAIDRSTGFGDATVVDKKGHDDWATKWLQAYLKSLAYEKLVVQHDKEPPLKGLVEKMLLNFRRVACRLSHVKPNVAHTVAADQSSSTWACCRVWFARCVWTSSARRGFSWRAATRWLAGFFGTLPGLGRGFNRSRVGRRLSSGSMGLLTRGKRPSSARSV